jgi:hypothetical protein
VLKQRNKKTTIENSPQSSQLLGFTATESPQLVRDSSATNNKIEETEIAGHLTAIANISEAPLP